MELNQSRIEDAIVAEVADKMVSDDTLWDRVKLAVDARINKHFAEVADERIRSAVELAISEGFERTYFKVNSYGQRDVTEDMTLECWSRLNRTEREELAEKGYFNLASRFVADEYQAAVRSVEAVELARVA